MKTSYEIVEELFEKHPWDEAADEALKATPTGEDVRNLVRLDYELAVRKYQRVTNPLSLMWIVTWIGDKILAIRSKHHRDSAVKFLRLHACQYYWSKVPEHYRSDEVAERIADLVNEITNQRQIIGEKGLDEI